MLATRSTDEERMDTDCRDFADYRRCLSDLAQVNAVTLTHRPMLGWLSRATVGLDRFSLLDVACGHGDALRRIHRWTRRRAILAQLEGIDLNPWATQVASEATDPLRRSLITPATCSAWTPIYRLTSSSARSSPII